MYWQNDNYQWTAKSLTMRNDPGPVAAAHRIQCYPMYRCIMAMQLMLIWRSGREHDCAMLLLATQQVRLQRIGRGNILLAGDVCFVVAGCTKDPVGCSIPSPGVRCRAQHHSRPVAVIVKKEPPNRLKAYGANMVETTQAISKYWLMAAQANCRTANQAQRSSARSCCSSCPVLSDVPMYNGNATDARMA
ncbi:uncharacterized protein LOC117565120 [Drosophila albomicans]|uniref:Uncharacterized protein LOC117565120 n=1 Tax=Drosophila albomicans TaxID=7291 RepID=A0A9C6WIB5_DROAB|nr:uncharacterized protein LOC117565120 [Drosophila albomicans]